MNPLVVRIASDTARRHPRLLAVAVFTGPVIAALVIVMIAAGFMFAAAPSQVTAAAAVSACTPDLPDHLPDVADLTGQQVEYAALIISVGQTEKVPPFGWQVAIAVAMQESGMTNPASRAVPESLQYPHDWVADGDHDSVGIMQQRPGWGSMAQRMDPETSIKLFYKGGTMVDGYHEPGLLDTQGWQDMELTEAAQAVQVSAFPLAYAAHEATAAALVEQLAGEDLGTCGEGDVSGRWVNPIDPDDNGQPGYLNYDNFGACSSLWESCHTGVDLSGIDGVPIYAASAGTVTYADYYGVDSYGWLVIIRHGDGVETYYAHNSSLSVTAGDRVEAGDQIAVSGSSGNTTGPHSHFEVRLDGVPVDPVPFMADHKAPL